MSAFLRAASRPIVRGTPLAARASLMAPLRPLGAPFFSPLPYGAPQISRVVLNAAYGGPLRGFASMPEGSEKTLVMDKKEGAEVQMAAPKTSLWVKIKHEVVHYWHGFRLFGIEIRVSSKYLWRMLKGENLSRREQRQMKRTSSDLVRMVPFLVFILVPFMELLIPVALKLFPNMLPSTFENKATQEEKRRKLLKVRLETAKFLRETITDVKPGTGQAEAAKQFSEFFANVRTSGEAVDTEGLLEVAKHFSDELTLDNLSRSQLVSMCRYMGIRVFGPDNFLRFQLRNRVEKLRADDRLISAEGVEALTLPELIHACSSRGIRTVGMSPARMRLELSGWLDLSIVHKVPSSLLILSRAFSLLAQVPASPTDALRATLESLPDELVQEAHLSVSEGEGGATPEQRLRVIADQEEMIAEEAERKRADEQRATEESEKISAESQKVDSEELLTDKQVEERESNK